MAIALVARDMHAAMAITEGARNAITQRARQHWAVEKARQRFTHSGVEVLVASELVPSIHSEPSFIATDLHPTAAFNERLARQLAASLASGSER